MIIFSVNQVTIYSLNFTVSLMDQMHWSMTSLYPSTKTYQDDISYKFYFVYFIDTDNQIIMFPSRQGIGRKNRPHLLTTQRTIII